MINWIEHLCKEYACEVTSSIGILYVSLSIILLLVSRLLFIFLCSPFPYNYENILACILDQSNLSIICDFVPFLCISLSDCFHDSGMFCFKYMIIFMSVNALGLCLPFIFSQFVGDLLPYPQTSYFLVPNYIFKFFLDNKRFLNTYFYGIYSYLLAIYSESAVV